jgi:hypothetical protein
MFFFRFNSLVFVTHDELASDAVLHIVVHDPETETFVPASYLTWADYLAASINEYFR